MDESVQLSGNASSSRQSLVLRPPLSYCNAICATSKEKIINQTLGDLYSKLKGNKIPYDQMQRQVYHLQRGKLWKQ